jgi:hypothetical protein
MRFGRSFKAAAFALSTAGVIAFAGIQLVAPRVHADDGSDSEAKLAAIGLRIAPPFLNLQGRDLRLVGLGSFIVNAQADCNGCHTSDPANEYLPTKNPYFIAPYNQKAIYNQATYLAGGQNFGPVGPGIVKDPKSPLFAGPGLGPNIISRNLTPDHTGNPEGGNDLDTFIKIMRNGHDFDKLHPACGGDVTDNCYSPPVNGTVLQVMPWPLYRHMTDRQLTAIWVYLRAVPCNAHNDKLGNTFPWLKNDC